MNNNPQIQEIMHLIQSLCTDEDNGLLNQVNIDEKITSQEADPLYGIIFRERDIVFGITKYPINLAHQYRTSIFNQF